MQSLVPSTFARHVSRASTEAVVGAAFSVQLAQLRQLLQLLLLLLLLALTMTSLAWPAVLLSVSKPGRRGRQEERDRGIGWTCANVCVNKSSNCLKQRRLANSLWQRLVLISDSLGDCSWLKVNALHTPCPALPCTAGLLLF